jgi:hypothetical protein
MATSAQAEDLLRHLGGERLLASLAAAIGAVSGAAPAVADEDAPLAIEVPVDRGGAAQGLSRGAWRERAWGSSEVRVCWPPACPPLITRPTPSHCSRRKVDVALVTADSPALAVTMLHDAQGAGTRSIHAIRGRRMREHGRGLRLHSCQIKACSWLRSLQQYGEQGAWQPAACHHCRPPMSVPHAGALAQQLRELVQRQLEGRVGFTGRVPWLNLRLTHVSLHA